MEGRVLIEGALKGYLPSVPYQESPYKPPPVGSQSAGYFHRTPGHTWGGDAVDSSDAVTTSDTVDSGPRLPAEPDHASVSTLDRTDQTCVPLGFRAGAEIRTPRGYQGTVLGAVMRRNLPQDDNARLWVEYRGHSFRRGFKDVHAPPHQEEALRGTLQSPGCRWMGKGKLKLVTSSSSRRADWAPRIAHPGDARDTGSAGTRGAAELGRASTAASSLSLFTTADAGEFGAAANTDDTHSDISDVDPSVATLAAASAEFRASISRGRRGLESSHGRPSTGSGWSAGGFGDGARHPAAAHMHSELFATTVSLQNSAISLPSSEEACLNPGTFELRSRPSSSGFFFPLASGQNNPTARAYHTASIHEKGKPVRAGPSSVATSDGGGGNQGQGQGVLSAAAAGRGAQKRGKGKGLLCAAAVAAARIRLLGSAGGPGSSLTDQLCGTTLEGEAGEGSGCGSETMQNPAQPSPPALDPLGVALSTRSFDRGDDSFGVKAGDLLVTPLGRTAEVVGVGLVHRAAMAADGMIHMSAPVLVPFVDFQTDGGWTKERTRRADWVGYRRGQGLAPMESHERMDEFTLSAEQRQDDNGGVESDGGGGSGATCDRGRGRNSSSGGLSLDSSHQLSASQPIGGGYKPRYTIAPEHVGIAARAKEMEALRSDCVRRRRDYEAQSQWRAARGAAPSEEEEGLVEWAARVRGVHRRQTAGPDDFQRGYLTTRAGGDIHYGQKVRRGGGGMAVGPKAPVAASVTRAHGGMKPLNDILPRPALDASQAHWTLNRPAAQGEYTPMGSANRACLI